ncbi:hypothetical protein IFM89_029156 [Coptis chinensis]|uniref:SKP1-like protein n=1 Tax=Coptis chinensis TaxID=261450 RepID=A0A835IQK1_9MAGN|nr:hypothetical protein IFM89_029156 [Coptis chinensis]
MKDSFNPSIEPPKKTVTLVSSDGYDFEVEEEVALESQVIKDGFEDKAVDDREYLLFNVHSDTLELIIKYCEKHVSSRKSISAAAASSSSSNGEEALKEWDEHFISVDTNTLYDILMAADYLNIKSLLDLAIQKVADTIHGRSPEQIRKKFNIENDSIIDPWASE